MIYFKKIFFVIIILLFVPFYGISEDNIAFINMETIMSQSLAGKSIKKQLEDEHKKNIDTFKKYDENLKKQEKDILLKKNILSKEEYEKEIKLLRAEVKKYRDERKEKIESLTKKRLNSIQKILETLSPILTNYSKEKNYALILDKKNIIVGKNSLDVTNEILSLLDKNVKKIKLK